MVPFFRYLFFQIPGWTIAALVTLGLLHWKVIPWWVALLGFCGLVLKDLVLYPLVRSAYDVKVKSGSAALVGMKGVVQNDLAPEGYVRINGELWRAAANGLVITAGTEVEVVSAEGMKVVVRALEGGSSSL
jgi:membrane protein implicated in regulation of membrane protease activity